MAYGYHGPEPEEHFRRAIRHYKNLIVVAIKEGYTEEQAIELLKVWALTGIEDNIGSLN